jgi:hypothetical protein
MSRRGGTDQAPSQVLEPSLTVPAGTCFLEWTVSSVSSEECDISTPCAGKEIWDFSGN